MSVVNMTTKPDQVVDVRGKSCPMPVLLTREKLKSMNCGEILEVVDDFSQAKDNILRFVEQAGNEILNVFEEENVYHIFIRRK